MLVYFKNKGISAEKRRLADILVQFLRFCVVGGLNTFIDIAAFNLLLWIFPTTHLHRQIIYNSLAYLFGALNSFFWNKLWTFDNRSKVTRSQVMRFVFVTGIGILCNDLFLWLATSILAMFSLSSFLWTNVAKVSAIAGSVMVSYVGMR